MSEPGMDPIAATNFEELKKITMTVLKQLEILQGKSQSPSTDDGPSSAKSVVDATPKPNDSDDGPPPPVTAIPSLLSAVSSAPPPTPENLHIIAKKPKAVRKQIFMLKQSTVKGLETLKTYKKHFDSLDKLGLVSGQFRPREVEQLKREVLFNDSTTTSGTTIDAATTSYDEDGSHLPATQRHPEVPRRNSDVSSISVTDGRSNRMKKKKRGRKLPMRPNLNEQVSRNHGKEKLVMQLLGLSHEEREIFLLLKAHQMNLIRLNSQTMQNEMLPMHMGAFNQYKMQAKAEIQQEIQKAVYEQQVQQAPRPPKVQPCYETLVTRLVFGLQDQDVVDFANMDQKLVLHNVSQAKTNGYLKAENIKALQEYVQRLVDLKIGYIFEGEIRINAKNMAEAYVSDPKGGRDVLVKSILLRRCALHGDIVRVLVLNMQVDLGTSIDLSAAAIEAKKNLGFVLDIVQKVNSRQFVGTLMPGRATKMQPRDPKLPLVEVVFASLKQKMELTLDAQNTLILAEIKNWCDDKPIAEIVKVIGKVDDLAAETKAILLQNNLDVTEYQQELLDTLPSNMDYKIPDEEYGRRQDLRDRCIFTIDPLTAKDLDDALSCRRLANGNYEVGVHISDVSHFLKEDSELDGIVKDKATSIYLANYVFHMLPRQLCMLCSLLPGEDKLAFSVFFELTEAAEVVSTHFIKSVVNSCAQLAYEHAQDMIEQPDKVFDADDLPPIHHGYAPSELSRIVNQLYQLSLKLRAKRMAAGALKINQPKLSFRLNPENGRPESYCVYPIKDSNRMIEDFMLLANQTVADYIFKKFPDISLLRCHEPPSTQGIKKLQQYFANHLLDFGITSAKDVQESIANIVATADSPQAAKTVINVLASKTMTRARYFCSGAAEPSDTVAGQDPVVPTSFSHYALCIPIYTHFTSPIRRYADVLVHRVLAAAIGCDEVPARDPDTLQTLAQRCNVQKYNAKIAGEESAALYFQHYVRSKGSLRMKAAVMGVYPYNLEVVLKESGDVVKVFYKFLEPQVRVKFLEFDDKPNHLVLSFPKENLPPRIVRMFSEIDVEVTVNKGKLTANRIYGDTLSVEEAEEQSRLIHPKEETTAGSGSTGAEFLDRLMSTAEKENAQLLGEAKSLQVLAMSLSDRISNIERKSTLKP